jgi:hypothetical protein
MCKWKLVGRKTLAIDSTTYRALYSKKNNYNEAKIKRQLTYLDTKFSEYFREMDALDRMWVLLLSVTEAKTSWMMPKPIPTPVLKVIPTVLIAADIKSLYW